MKAVLLVALAVLAACGVDDTQRTVTVGGNGDRGRALLRTYGCVTCHSIPGVRGARSYVGPSLDGIASRMYIAGVLPNDPDNMVRWIMDPLAVDSKTAMPKVGVNERDARDMAEYLYRLRAREE